MQTGSLIFQLFSVNSVYLSQIYSAACYLTDIKVSAKKVTLKFVFSLQKFSKELEKLFGPDGNNLFEKRKNKSFLQAVSELGQSMREFQKEPGNLKEYSPWLSGFKSDPFGNELEVPGLSAE